MNVIRKQKKRIFFLFIPAQIKNQNNKKFVLKNCVSNYGVQVIGGVYQTAHFFAGFIGFSSGQPKSLANWGMLANGPRTRNREGECAPVKMRSFSASGRDF